MQMVHLMLTLPKTEQHEVKQIVGILMLLKVCVAYLRGSEGP